MYCIVDLSRRIKFLFCLRFPDITQLYKKLPFNGSVERQAKGLVLSAFLSREAHWWQSSSSLTIILFSVFQLSRILHFIGKCSFDFVEGQSWYRFISVAQRPSFQPRSLWCIRARHSGSGANFEHDLTMKLNYIEYEAFIFFFFA